MVKDVHKKKPISYIYAYLHFASVTINHKTFPVSVCSTSGTSYLCRGHLWNSSHAEVNALKKIPYYRLKDKKFCKKIIINVVRFDPMDAKNNIFTLVDSKPCLHCLKMLQKFGIEKVNYSMKCFPFSLVRGKVSTMLAQGDFSISSGHRQY